MSLANVDGIKCSERIASFGTCRHCEIGALCLGLKRICSKMRSLFCILKMLNSLALFLLGLCNLVCVVV